MWKALLGGMMRVALDVLPPTSRLILVSDSSKWVIAGELRELSALARRLGIRMLPDVFLPWSERQSVFFGSHFDLLLSDRWFRSRHRLATAYFHGKPGTGCDEFDRCFDQLKRHRERVDRIQVSCQAMRALLLETGIDAGKVFTIPIAVNLSYFRHRGRSVREKWRRKLTLSESVPVVGSFQKDGVGWGEGNVPKWIKGPDSLVETLRLLRERLRDLHVVLSGPARGFVKRRLTELKIPFRHVYLSRYRQVCELYQALDAYVVASREEGGPRAVLEAMAAGIPLISTRVGQAVDLVEHGRNGWLADVGDAPALAHWTEHALRQAEDVRSVVSRGIETASRNTYESQLPLWAQFFDGFVERQR